MISRNEFASLYNCWLEKGYNYDMAKEKPYCKEEGGIPVEMWASAVDEDGGVKWKIVESKVSETDINSLEREFTVILPDQLIEYLLSPSHCFDQVNNGKRLVMLFSMPSDNPLQRIKREWSGWIPLIKAGYLPIAEMEDSWGPICYKQENERIVWFDHEAILDLDTSSESFAFDLTKYEKPLHESLEEFFRFTFTEHKHDAT